MKEVVLNEKDVGIIAHMMQMMDIYEPNKPKGSNERFKLWKKIYKQQNKKPIKISSRKAKGRGFEQKVAKQVAELIDCPYGTDDNALVSYRQMGMSGTDIILRGDAALKFPYAIETKAQESINLKEAWEQTLSNTTIKTYPMLCIKNKKIGELYILTWDGIVNLYRS